MRCMRARLIITRSYQPGLQRALHGPRPKLQNMRIDHRRRQLRVPQQLLHGADVIARLEQMRRERVPQGVTSGRLPDPGRADGPLDRFLQRRLRDMVPPLCAAGAWINGALARRKNALPRHLKCRGRVLSSERERKVHLPAKC